MVTARSCQHRGCDGSDVAGGEAAGAGNWCQSVVKRQTVYCPQMAVVGIVEGVLMVLLLMLLPPLKTVLPAVMGSAGEAVPCVSTAVSCLVGAVAVRSHHSSSPAAGGHEHWHCGHSSALDCHPSADWRRWSATTAMSWLSW